MVERAVSYRAAVYKTDAVLRPLKPAEVASSAAVLFQSQLASVNTTSGGNGNMLEGFEGAHLVE